VRLKRYIEVRSADSQPPEMMLALPALVKGILYEPDAMDAAWTWYDAGHGTNASRFTTVHTGTGFERRSAASCSPSSRASCLP